MARRTPAAKTKAEPKEPRAPWGAVWTPEEKAEARKHHHFPREGEKLVNGEWTLPPKERLVLTAADRRNWYRKQAGWPALKGA